MRKESRVDVPKNMQNNLSNTQESKEIVHLNNVSKIFHTSFGDFPALKEVNLTIKPGNLVCILGKSGSGKSTLINMMAGIDHPSSGEVIINGTNLQKMKEGEISVWRGKNLGIVFQFFQLLPTLSVLENTILPMDFSGLTPKTLREEKARSLLRTLEIETLADYSPNAISTGHQQCAAIARALANDPPIILADEPTGNLDTKTGEMVIQIFKKLVSMGKTIIMVTHDRKLALHAQRILMINDGVLLQDGFSHVFFELNEHILAKIVQKSTTKEFQTGEKIFPSLPNQTWFCIIEKGEVAILNERKQNSSFSNQNKLLKEGDTFLRSNNSEQYLAVSNCQIISVPNPELIQLSNSEIQQVNRFIQPLSSVLEGDYAA